MLREIYVVLLRLHPPRFRRQFADEMLWIFDQTAGTRTRALFADALQSLVTQWIFREFDEPPSLAGMPGAGADRVPVFYTSGSDIPPPSALLNGLILSVGIFALACFALAHSAARPRIFTYYGSEFHAGPAIGDTTPGPAVSFHPPQPDTSPGFWSRLTSAFHSSSAGKLSETPPVEVTPTPGLPDSSASLSGPPIFGRFKPIQASRYFKSVPVLSALDADHDGKLSPEEIANAPAALAVLDKNHDGKLDAEECGYHVPAPPNGKSPTGKLQTLRLPPNQQALLPAPGTMPLPQPGDPVDRRARVTFMHVERVLAALDSDHDGVISRIEIFNAAAALKTLDRNHDGRLTLDEIIPDPVAREVAAIFRLDADFDGRISQAERQNPFGRHVQKLLDAADRNGKPDGYVTWEELTNEIRRRADLDHDGVVTWEELMNARASGALN